MCAAHSDTQHIKYNLKWLVNCGALVNCTLESF